MKSKNVILFIAASMLLIFWQCNSPRYVKYQNKAYKKVHHSIEKASNFEQYNKYQKDFLILAHLVKDEYPNYQEYLSKKEWQEAVDLGLSNLAVANDTTAILEYQKFLAKLKNNHTLVVYPMIYTYGRKCLFVSHISYSR
jgi:hypothetical protein